MATAARAAMAGGPAATVPRTLPGAGIGQYALLGALGFELPGFTSVLAPGGTWVSDLMRRGTPDPQRSRVAVPASEFPLAMARAGLTIAGADAAAAAAVRGFGSGMLAAAAAGVMVGPQLADLLARDTNADWHRHSQSGGAAAAERYLRRRFLGGEAVPAPLIDWLPTAKSVPTAVWDGYLRALSDVYGLPEKRALGFPLFEDGLDTGDWLTAVRMRNAYNLVLDDLRTSSWPAPAWWGLLTPILLAPSISMLAARTLPNAGLFFAEGDLTPRSVFELLTLSMGIGSVAPFVYSMILWSAVDEHTEVFVTALIMFLARAGIVTGALATSGNAEQSSLTQWLGMFAPLVSLDIYALIRSLAAGSRRPGDSTVFAIQTIPAATGGLTLIVSAVMKALGINTGWPFWLVWSLFTAIMWLLVGIIAVHRAVERRRLAVLVPALRPALPLAVLGCRGRSATARTHCPGKGFRRLHALVGPRHRAPRGPLRARLPERHARPDHDLVARERDSGGAVRRRPGHLPRQRRCPGTGPDPRRDDC